MPWDGVIVIHARYGGLSMRRFGLFDAVNSQDQAGTGIEGCLAWSGKQRRGSGKHGRDGMKDDDRIADNNNNHPLTTPQGLGPGSIVKAGLFP